MQCKTNRAMQCTAAQDLPTQNRISCNMPKQIGLSLVSDLAPTVTARCGGGYLTNYLGGHHYPILGILVIDETDTIQRSQRHCIHPYRTPRWHRGDESDTRGGGIIPPQE